MALIIHSFTHYNKQYIEGAVSISPTRYILKNFSDSAQNCFQKSQGYVYMSSVTNKNILIAFVILLKVKVNYNLTQL